MFSIGSSASKCCPLLRIRGVLPPSDYELSLEELRESILVRGPQGRDPGWDSAWRAKLVDNLSILVAQLWQIGIYEIFINGSFVEDRNRPNDIDGYFVCDLKEQVSGRLLQKLNALDPHQAWGWYDHLRHPGRKLPLWNIYRVVLWPYSIGTRFGTDRSGNYIELSEAFRRVAASGLKKGIIKLKPPRRGS